MKPTLRIGTRGSGLALWQARHVKHLISQANPDIITEIIVIKTTGDKNLASPLDEIGGKGVFVKEIEEALLSDKIDIAVHSLKDVPTELPAGLVLRAFAERHDPRDALITKSGFKLSELARGSMVATGSLRRASQILHHYPELNIVSIRGNVDTRVRKLKEVEGLDAVVLALAGLARMGLEREVTEIIAEEVVVPAPGQGIVGAFLKRLSGDCNVPVGCRSVIDGDAIFITGVLASPDGGTLIKESVSGKVEDAELLGERAAEMILNKGGERLLDELSRS
jgi:hydroxymethylbilane synthase